ncbi:MAG: YqhA family protein [Desulfovibrio sp.]|nr:YqhA family protein [Desulfovibrio sp.]
MSAGLRKRLLAILEELFETFLFNSRLFTILAVLGSLASSLAMFVKGTLNILKGLMIFYGQIVNFHLGEEHGPDTLVAVFVSSVDNYLFATVLLIFSMGLYELFVSEIDPASRQADTRPNWLNITDLDHLKSSLGKVILLILIVSFFEQSMSIEYKTALDLLYLGLGVLFIAGALTLMHKAHKNENAERTLNFPDHPED